MGHANTLLLTVMVIIKAFTGRLLERRWLWKIQMLQKLGETWAMSVSDR